MTALHNELGEKRLQWIATADIGIFAALAFENPSKYNHKAIGLAGDDLNVDELSTAFGKKTGNALTPTFWFLGTALTTLVGEMRAMLKWFASDGYGADIQKCRNMNPKLMDFETWIEKESKFVTR
jgi:NmrA-like family